MESVDELTTSPFTLVVRSAEASELMAKVVDVALVVVLFEASKFTKCDVEEAKIPACAQMAVPVAAVVWP